MKRYARSKKRRRIQRCQLARLAVREAATLAKQFLIIFLVAWVPIAQGAPSAATFPTFNSPGNLGGKAELPLVDADPSPAPPAAGAMLTVTGSVEDGLTLKWSAVSYAVDNYVVEKREGPEGWAEKGTVSAATFTFPDGDVEANRRYHYRVVPLFTQAGQTKRGAPLRANPWIEWDFGALQTRQRSGSAALHGFASFIPKEDENVYTHKKYQYSESGSTTLDSYVGDYDHGPGVTTTSSSFNVTSDTELDPLTGNSTTTSNGSSNYHYNYAGDSEENDSWSWTASMTNGVWEGDIGSAVFLLNSSSKQNITKTVFTTITSGGGSTGVFGMGSYPIAVSQGQGTQNETTTLSGPISARDALPIAQSNLPAWSDEAWEHGRDQARLILSKPGWVNAPGWVGSFWGVTASLTELQYRFTFGSEPAHNSVKRHLQYIDIPEDDRSTEGIDESRANMKFSYSPDSSYVNGASYDSELERYVTPAENVPDGNNMEPGHRYAVRRFSVNLSISDYRGTADFEEQNAGAGFVSDPYAGSTSSEYYVPEPAGPAIFLGSGRAASVEASFSGGVDHADWEGTLSWSSPGGQVVITRAGDTAPLSGDLQLGKQSDGSFVSKESLVITAGEEATAGTVSFQFVVKDSKGKVVGTETANLHLVAGTPEDPAPGDPPDDYFTIPISDACGPAYRKISLYGRPIPDASPEAAAETDSAREETYIDAYSLNLRHSTTDIYVPVPGSDLALTVRRNVEAEVWNFQSGLRPHERPDRPFGSGWSSNLGASIEFMTPTGMDVNGFLGPQEATVTDDEGNRFRFFLYDEDPEDEVPPYYFPYPSSSHEAKMYLSTMTIEGSGYVFRQKYGKTLEFEPVGSLPSIANDRLHGGTDGAAYSYARLTKVTDRLGYNLRYHYGGDDTLIPDLIEAYHGGSSIPGLQIYIRQNDATRCVTAVWDPSGKKVSYGYAAHIFPHPKLPGAPPQKLNVLKTVSAPDTSTVYLDYEGEAGGKPYVIEEDPIRRLNPNDQVDTYQINLAGIRQSAETGTTKFSFEYETDDSRQIYVRVPGTIGYVTQAGSPRRVRKVSVPGGEARFSSLGSMRILYNAGDGVLESNKGSSVVDAEGHRTDYQFGGSSFIVLKKFEDLFLPESKVRKPKLVFYTEMKIGSRYGSETYSFDKDAAFALTQVTDFCGNETAYEYGDIFAPTNTKFSEILPQGFFKFNDPTTITRPGLGNRILSYSGNFRILKSSTNENGHKTEYTIDSLGRRTVEKRFQGTSTEKQRTTFDYDSSWKGFVTRKTVETLTGDPGGTLPLVTEFGISSDGRTRTQTVKTVTDGDLTTTSLYNWNDSLVFTTAPGGISQQSAISLRTRFDYDGRQRLRKVTFEDDSYKEMTYDGRGRKTTERDENGNVTSFRHDAADRLVTKTRRVPTAQDIVESFRYNKVGSLLDSVNPRKFTTTRTYDGLQRLTSISEPGKGVTRFFYDGKNSGPSLLTPSAFQPTRIIDPRGYQTTNFCDSYYRLTRSERKYGAGLLSTRFEYDDVGNRTHVYDGLGKLTKTDYDALNRPVKITNALNKDEQFFYTSTGLLWKKRDFRGKETITQHDGAGRPTKVIFPTDGSPFRLMAYDRANNLVTLTDERSKVTTYEYNTRNRQTTETKPSVFNAETGSNAPLVTTKAYDFVGNVIDLWDARNMRTHYVYDAANRLTETHAAYQTGDQISTFTEYDPCGNALTVTDGRGHDTVNTYDAANRLETTTNAENITTRFGYDPAGNRTSVTDGKTQTTRFAYDGLNRLTKTTDPAGKSVEFQYDAVNKTARIDSLRRKTSYYYDDLHRLKAVAYDGAPGDTSEYTYDDNGNILSVDQPGDERDVAYTYDELNRPLTETSNGVEHTYTYDPAGNRDSIEYGGTGRSLTLAYDDINRLESITDGDHLTEYKYTLNGGEASRIFKANGSTVTSKIASTYDVFNRLDLRTGYQGASTPIYTYDADYDKNSNVTGIAETYSSGLSNRTLSMEYDDANRLLVENSTAGGVLTKTEFHYDAADNRDERKITDGAAPSVTATYAYNSLNQLTGVTFSDSTPAISFGYDADGNRISRSQGSDHTAYGYDMENRLTSARLGTVAKKVNISPVMGTTLGAPAQVTYYVVTGSGTLHEYSYDYRTRRVKRIEDGETTKIVFSSGTSVLEMTGNATPSTPTVEFVRGVDMGGGVGGLLYTDREGTISFGHYNNRGDVVAKTDASGAVTYRAAYKAFGSRAAEQGSTLDRQKMNTKDEDPTGLVNHGFRYYDLETDTWLTRDPAGFIDGPNLYAYVQQNPWTSFDPQGLQQAYPDDRYNPHAQAQVAEGLLRGLNGALTLPKLFLRPFMTSPGSTEQGQAFGDLFHAVTYMPGSDLRISPQQDVAAVKSMFTTPEGLGNLAGGLLAGKLITSLRAPELAPSGMSAQTISRLNGEVPAVGTEVSRNWGGKSGPFGESWTDVPFSQQSREGLGLGRSNTGEFASFGSLTDISDVTTRPALPWDGFGGGQNEILVPQAQSKIKLDAVVMPDNPLPDQPKPRKAPEQKPDPQ